VLLVEVGCSQMAVGGVVRFSGWCRFGGGTASWALGLLEICAVFVGRCFPKSAANVRNKFDIQIFFCILFLLIH